MQDQNPAGLKIGFDFNGGSHEREGRYTNQAVKADQLNGRPPICRVL